MIDKTARGRKPKGIEQYIESSNAKIADWRIQIKNGKDNQGRKLNATEKQKLRNCISALQSRMRKKQETVQHDEISDRIDSFVNIILNSSKASERDSLLDRVRRNEQRDQTDEFKQLAGESRQKDQRGK